MVLLDLKGVGAVTLAKLEKLGITDIPTLLYHFPSRYTDRRKRLMVIDLLLVENESYHCIGRITKLKKIWMRGGREMTTGTIIDDTGDINVAWFNNPYITSIFKVDDNVIFSGSIQKGKMVNPKLKKISNQEDIDNFAKVEATYPETKGLKSHTIQQFERDTLLKLWRTQSGLKESLPIKVLKKEKLIGRLEALKYIHFPDSDEELEKARERLGFEEIYNILKQVNKRKKILKKFEAHHVRINQTPHELLIEKLSFTLTDTQKVAIKEIFKDLGSLSPMHRLLNGDVGSGKTIVAASAAWQVVNNGLQVVILAPTGVLANQHYQTFKNLFGEYGVPIHLATLDTRKEVDALYNEINNAKDHNHILIGTHALFHRMDLFKKVGLLVIDEQHKFGVKQRELLANLQTGDTGFNTSTEGSNNMKVPHVLSMSATPIPRSLALTLFGDIEVSFLEAKPEGRKSIITKIINEEEKLERMYDWLGNEIRDNRAQAYVICPLIQESEKLDVKSAIKEFENLRNKYPDLEVELLHGKLKPKEKDAILERFRDGQIQILVSTSVIEVGIDCPNATIMVIEGAERFGLAQLHQIRGRVGRSDKQSYCFLKTSDGNSNERLNFFESSDDGFKVAEFDLQMRGPGEVYGEVQSGIPNLKIANIMDIALVKRVKKYFK